MAWNSLQLHEREYVDEAVTTMTMPLEVDGEGEFGAGGPDGVGGRGGATTQSPSLLMYRDRTTTTSLTATMSHRHHINLMFLLGTVLSNLKTDAEEKGVAPEILSGIAMHVPGLI